MYPLSVYFGMFIQFLTTIPLKYIGFDQAAEGLDEGSFLSLHQPRTSHEYYLCILAMFTMSREDVKHGNWPSLEVLSLRVWKCETCWESAIKQSFLMTATSLKM